MRKKINTRAFISATLFILLIIIFVTAVAVQILDEMIDPKILISLYLNPQSEPNFLVELLHIIKAVHVAAGFTFAATAVFHILKNWKTLKSCFKSV